MKKIKRDLEWNKIIIRLLFLKNKADRKRNVLKFKKERKFVKENY